MSSSDLADLFPGFASHWIDTSIGRMFARSGGAGPALLLVHGYAPSNVMWHGMDRKLAMKVWHWLFLAQPHPLPEMLIGKAPVEYLDWKMASWTKAKDLSAFDPRALAHYRAFFSDPSRIHATCEDYRAGQTGDLAADEHDRAAGKKIARPMLALWGAAGIPSETAGPLKIWREWAERVEGGPIDSGHFLAEENPQA